MYNKEYATGSEKGEPMNEINDVDLAADFARQYPETIQQLAQLGGSARDVRTFVRVGARGKLSQEDIHRIIRRAFKVQNINNVGALITSWINKAVDRLEGDNEPASVLLKTEKEPVMESIKPKEPAVVRPGPMTKVSVRLSGETIKLIDERRGEETRAAMIRSLVEGALTDESTTTSVDDESATKACGLLRQAINLLEDTSEEDELFNFEVDI